MKRAPIPETAVAAIVVAHLEALGADVYQEVEGIDIVARVGAELWIVEVKTSLSLALLYQAIDRRRHAHRVIIAAPHTKHQGDAGIICAELGIGLWIVHAPSPGYDLGSGVGHAAVRELAASRRWNSRPVALAGALRPEHKTHAKAGTPSGAGAWTPWRDTCEQLARLVTKTPGVTLKAAIDGIRHHYRSTSSARSSLATWIKAGRVAGVELRMSPASIAQLWPVEARR